MPIVGPETAKGGGTEVAPPFEGGVNGGRYCPEPEGPTQRVNK